MMHKQWLSQEDFETIYSKVPRLNVDLVIHDLKEGIVLVRRSIEPSIGSWHLPGGTVYKTETVEDASKRVAKNETGFDVEVTRCLGYMEFPHEKRGSIEVHTISIAMEVKIIGGELKKDNNAQEIGIFTELPFPFLPGHDEFLISHKLLVAKKSD